MMLLWMIYVVVVTLILGCAALAAEHWAQIARTPTRWLWGTSLIASLILPVVMSSVSIQIPRLTGAVDQAAPPAAIPLRQIAAVAVQPSAWLGPEVTHMATAPDVDTLLTWGWGVASGLMLLALLVNGLLLNRRKRAWTRQVMAGAPVLVSEDVGPAIVGLLRPRIVAPRWVVEADPEVQALVLAHEQSHLDANDAQLLAAAILLIAAMPWNAPLWWLLRRLRFAIEVDCDARVLRGGHDVSRYGEALIMVGERQSGHVAVAAAMSESSSFLEQRIRKMLSKRGKFAWASGAAMAALGFVLAASAAVVSPPNAGPPSMHSTTGQGLPDPDATPIGSVAMKHYKNAEWNFALDIPARWNAFPPVPTNSPFEVVRFASEENGAHGLIVFRGPYDPKLSPQTHSDQVQAVLAKGGFTHFAAGETRIGSRSVRTLDFDKQRPDGKTWSVREYFILDGTLTYTLGFGSTDRSAMFDLYDRMAKRFTFGEALSPAVAQAPSNTPRMNPDSLIAHPSGASELAGAFTLRSR